MPKQNNEYGVKVITMFPAVNIVCPISQAPVKLKAKVEFFPDEFVPEFMEAQNHIRQQIEGKKLTIEGAADALLTYFNETYSAKGVRVVVTAENNNTHFSVNVEAEVGDCSGKNIAPKKPAKEKPAKPAPAKTSESDPEEEDEEDEEEQDDETDEEEDSDEESDDEDGDADEEEEEDE